MSIDKSERYLKDIAKHTAEIVKELKRMNTKVDREKKLAEQKRLRSFTQKHSLNHRLDRERVY